MQVADTGPSPRVCRLAYDSARSVAVLFGGFGNDGDVFDTWEWDGVVWREVEDIGPSLRQAGGMVGTVDDVLLFGGSGEGGLLGDTWAWDGERWRQRQDIGPSPRHSPAMAWDASRDRPVLFGGQAPTGTSLVAGDTWEAFEES